jgi:hypothetical protein
MHLTISYIAARTLTNWLDQVMVGELKLWELPPQVAAIYFAGWSERDLKAQADAREHEHQLDRMYLAAFSPKDRSEEYQRRLDEYFASESERFFTEPSAKDTTIREAA